MKNPLSVLVVGVSCLMFSASFAQTPAAAPSGATAMCKDGTYYTGTSHSGACSRHKGVQQWLDTSVGAQAAANNAPSTSTQIANSSAPTRRAPARTASSDAGVGKVWVNLPSKVYHCPSDRYYGKTKNGEYLPEADAKAQGFRPDHGKTCEQRAAG